jgi:hypothetical protein
MDQAPQSAQIFHWRIQNRQVFKLNQPGKGLDRFALVPIDEEPNYCGAIEQ